MKNELIPSPFSTKELVKGMADKKEFKELADGVPIFSVMFTDAPLESTLMDKNPYGTIQVAITQELQYRAKTGGNINDPVMILVIERDSLLGGIENIKSGMVTYSLEKNMMTAFKVQGQLL